MLTEEKRDALLGELSKPYSPEELALHLKDRPLKSVLEKIHAHNLALVDDILVWIAWTQGETAEPKDRIWSKLRPGHHLDNPACLLLDELVDVAVNYGAGNVPLVSILPYAARSTLTLVVLLDQLHHTPEIDAMDAAATDFFALLADRNTTKRAQADFAARLKKLKEDFVKACVKNAAKLHTFILARREACAKVREPAKDSAKSSHAEETVKVLREAHKDIVRTVRKEGAKTRRKVASSAKKVVTDIRTRTQSDYDKRGPSSSARAYQLKAVITRMREYKADPKNLPAPLRKKHPAKWIRQACTDAWIEKDGGYPSIDALYNYCHHSEARILSLAGC